MDVCDHNLAIRLKAAAERLSAQLSNRTQSRTLQVANDDEGDLSISEAVALIKAVRSLPRVSRQTVIKFVEEVANSYQSSKG